MTPVSVTGEPATTVASEAELVRARSAVPALPTVTIAVLLARLGSVVPEVMLATSTICAPLAAVAATVTAMVKVTPAVLTGKTPEVVVQEIVPAVLAQLQPAGGVMEETVVLTGTFCVKTALTASRGPLLATTWV